MSTVITEPGVYPGILNATYHADPVAAGSLSVSGAKKMLDPYCPAIYKHERVVGATIQERFESFHGHNEWILTELEKLAQQMLDAGRKRMSIETLIGRIRWDYNVATTGDPFRINDHYSSRYVRLMIARHPEWAEVFTLRNTRAA